ncbi:DUF4142 domain-containing protein [Nocardia aobensis]|uniref:DUF4142 domain-containing protein n=1 Tax=Nocardia aobensis TaxID=257277 RepID=UPI0012F700F7|nr:DUF4142 domain-containing protein [Nocardia aobensis]
MRSPHRLLVVTAAAVGLGLGATGVGAAQPAALSAQDSDFLVAVHQGNLTEMLSGAGAAAMGTCQQVRDLGPVLVTDHTRLEAMGAAVAIPNGVALPLMPSADQTQQMRETAMKTGRDYDLAWLHMQEGFHVQTLQAGATETAQGSSPQVTALAQNAAPMVQHHLDMIRDALAVC